MVSLDITIMLPDDLAREAQERGLLRPEEIGRLIGEELRKQRADHFFDVADKIAAIDKGDLTEADIEAEIQAYRAEKRDRRASGG